MGLMDTLMGALTSAAGQHAGNKGAMDGIMDLLGGGGIKGLLREFQGKGLEELVSSWVGTGKNIPVSTDQIKEVLGMDRIREFARKAGVDEDTSIDMLKDMLPEVVDKMTPNGSVEE